MDSFGLSAKGDKLHVLVSVLDSEGVLQRAWCGKGLGTNNIAWDIKSAAEAVKEGDITICKRCAKGNPKLMLLLQEEQA
jgi:hypothetical protein